MSRGASQVAGYRDWLRRHPTTSDAAFALLVNVTALIPYAARPDAADVDLELTTVALISLTAGSLLLVLRRQAPWPVWLLTTAVGLVAVVDAGGTTPAFLPACVALYTVAVTSPTGRAAAAGVVSALAPGVALLGLGSVNVIDALAYGMTPWSGLATMSGIAVRNQRAMVAAAHERARQAEATREEEAQRRVAEERLRIARELHDVVAHHVAVVNVQAGLARHLLRADPDAAAEAMGHVREASQTILDEVPGLLGLLRSTEDELETAPAPRLGDVGGLVERARRSGLLVTWETTGTPLELPPATDLTAYRVVQEGLTNALRHGSGKARLMLKWDAGGCHLEVRNPVQRPSTESQGARHGLIGMRERVAAVGGTLTAGREGDEWVVRARLLAGVTA
ncbi:sensor histidine kinase [Nocardioides renjunii]|uniref:sensor histidine kinase n=1 Tax=Nocardioides renjunii TaxID=3095075 RepID=UPI002AFE58F4|nr:histidine kinase [Nocardioides sp. S-34]WQQ20467.1 histidine kinase [Nocardioides sp. S-34]